MTRYLQRDQPPGVAPLELTGERTLPDVPEENYWYRRHLAAYRWVADRCAGKRVVDMACGEGYGSAVLAERAREVVGVDASPEAHEHARLKYVRPALRFARALVEQFEDGAPYEAIVFLQTIEHVEAPRPLLERFASLLAPGGTAYVSTPNRLTLAPPGAERSDNPWHVREYTAGEYGELLRACFRDVELLGLFHARRLRLHDAALRLGWERVHRASRLTGPFYRWFAPSIGARDFVLRSAPAGERVPRDPRPLDRALDFLAVCRP